MKKIILYSQILLMVLMAQNVHADALVGDPLRGATEAEYYDIDQLSNQTDFFHIRTPVPVIPSTAFAKGLHDNGIISTQQLRKWIRAIDETTITSEEKKVVQQLTVKYFPTTDTVAIAKKHADRKTEIADTHAKKSREKIESAKLSRAQYEKLLQDKKDNRAAKKNTKKAEKASAS
ncbi:MAG: hypothetical protein WC747_00675 [Candidatus Babeliales bacterium]|jgi:transposase-like protein